MPIFKAIKVNNVDGILYKSLLNQITFVDLQYD